MTKLRSLLVTIPITMAATAALILASLGAVVFFRKASWQQALFRLWARWILRICRVRLEVSGTENIGVSEHHIFVANHSSLIDVPVLAACLPVGVCFLVKQELFRIPLFGAYLRRTGQIPVDRSGPKASFPDTIAAALRAGEGGKSLVMFPEGTRSPSLGEFKDGAAWIAIHSGIPLIPVGISGAARVWPGRSTLIHGGSVQVRIGPPISAERLKVNQRRELTARLRRAVEELLKLEPGRGTLHPSD